MCHMLMAKQGVAHVLTHTHISDSLLVNGLICLILVLLQETFEPTLDLFLDAVRCNPIAQRPFDVFKGHVQIAHGVLQHIACATCC